MRQSRSLGFHGSRVPGRRLVVDTNTRQKRLKAYETYSATSAPMVERLFWVVLLLCLAAFLGLGLFFGTIEPTVEQVRRAVKTIRTEFLIREEKEISPPPPPPKPEKKIVKEEPVDLTTEPKLAQKEDDIQESTPKEKSTKKVRRVYGLKKVYSRGLGSGGDMSDAVVGKLGNTLNKDVDTLTATKEDVKGEVVSVTTVTNPPRFRKAVKPEYTKEMLENRVEGTVKVRALIDVDGKAKSAKAQNSLGFGTGSAAEKAIYDSEFHPAVRGEGRPVAVWVVIPVEFRMLGS